MKTSKRFPLLRPALFALGGGLVGLGSYFWIGCASGVCPITSNPVSAALYFALVGWLLSGVFDKECETICNI